MAVLVMSPTWATALTLARKVRLILATRKVMGLQPQDDQRAGDANTSSELYSVFSPLPRKDLLLDLRTVRPKANLGEVYWSSTCITDIWVKYEYQKLAIPGIVIM
ncbi:hypothetical protein HYALB_00004405 [Hymenoscyphus albidus]|uniref:Uncharacterized protein n=1 Tax=Hymenoscyphus albidus TaxID=595503 RepID=A0A9N9LKJ3_9HELO|nr:hypothetical protein HYALB_00004405 [Hymenoscyphus albidus]